MGNPWPWILEIKSGIPESISSTYMESAIKYLEYGIHSVESRIQDYRGLP